MYSFNKRPAALSAERSSRSRMTVVCLTIFALSLLTQTTVLQATNATIISYDPASNARSVVLDSDVKINFSHAMSSASLRVDGVNPTVLLHGSLSGWMSSGATLTMENGDKRLVIDPSVDFHAGEMVSLVVSGAHAQAGYPLQNGRVANFYTKTAKSDGAFTPSYNKSGFVAIQGMTTGDYNGDGIVDVAYCNNGAALYVYLNNGNGDSFTNSYSQSVNNGFDFVSLDFDLDGDLDIVGIARNILEIFANNGDGTFVHTRQTMAHERLWRLRTGDLNGDGLIDISAGVNGGNTTLPPYVFFSNGDGTFTEKALPYVQAKVALPGDFDGDGDLDVVLSSSRGNSKLLLNDGHGNFSESDIVLTGDEMAQAGDIDGDGDLDVVIGTNNAFRQVLLWINDGSGSFTAKFVGPTSGHKDLRLGDIDGDGDLDAVMARVPFIDERPGGIAVLFNDGNGKFSFNEFGGFYEHHRYLRLADINGDGDLDILSGGWQTNGFNIYSNVPAPKLNRIANADCVFAGDLVSSLTLCGDDFDIVTGATLCLPNGADTDLPIITTASTKLTVAIDPDMLLAAGNFTIKLLSGVGITSAQLTVHSRAKVTGPTCVYSGQQVKYTFEPELDPEEYSSLRTDISGALHWRQLGTHCFEVEWDPASSATISRTVVFAEGCEYTTTLSVQHSPYTAADDLLTIATGATTTADVLANDGGNNKTLTSVATPSHGSAQIVNNHIEYTAPNNFNGVIQIRYEATAGSSDCPMSAFLIITIGEVERNESIEFVEREKDGRGGVLGMRRTSDVIVSPDGQHVYVAGKKDYAIVLFKRDGQSGELEYVRRWRENADGVKGLRNISNLAISADGSHVYATGLGSGRAVVFDRNPANGFLKYRSNVKLAGTGQPRGLAVSDDDKYIYVCASRTSALEVFERNDANDRLTRIQRLRDQRLGVDGINTATDVAISPDGRHVYVTGSGDDAVAMFVRDELSGMLTYLGNLRDGQNGVNGLRAARGLKVSADGKNVYVAGSKDKAVAVLARNSITGMLTFIEMLNDNVQGVKNLAGPSDVAVSPDGVKVFAADRVDNSMVHFSRSAADGTLKFDGSFVDGKARVDGLRNAMAITTSGDGRFIYVAGSVDDAVAVFRRTGEALARDDEFDALYAEDFDASLNSRTRHLAVLDNDVAPFGGQRTITGVTQPGIGSVAITADGQKVIYIKPDAATAFPDGVPANTSTSFTYTMDNDTGNPASAEVTVRLSGADESEKRAQPNDNAQPHSELSTNDAQTGPALLESLNASPNPTAGASTISFRLNTSALVTVNVLDINGRVIARLVDANYQAGEYHIKWNGAAINGRELPSGSYFIAAHATTMEARSSLVFPLMIAR